MLMKRNLSLCALIALLVCAVQVHAEITLLDSNYRVEKIGEYQQDANIGLARYIAADGSGNVYVSHGNGSNKPSSLMFQIAADGTIFKIATSGQNFQGIALGEGTAFGDSVLIAETYTKTIQKVNYPISSFNLPGQPVAINIDRTGNYGNLLYAGTQSTPHIYSISETGSVSEFVDLTYTGAKRIIDLEIDPTGRYNGFMYITMDEVDNLNYSGILAIDQQGNVSQFLVGGYWGGRFAFDTTESFDFGGDMYISLPKRIKSMSPDGDQEDFLTTDRSIQNFAFGLDGALYILELDDGSELDQTISLYKVTLVPEPATLVLLGFGAIGLIRRKK